MHCRLRIRPAHLVTIAFPTNNTDEPCAWITKENLISHGWTPEDAEQSEKEYQEFFAETDPIALSSPKAKGIASIPTAPFPSTFPS